MKTSLGQMDGNGWEDYCQKLLRLRYDDYQEVPAQFGGDFGIEGFTRSGLVFQCYCPDEDLSGKELYDKQRDKITKDIKKLIKNAPKISELGAGIIMEWQLITPHYNNKQLHLHCRSKEKEVQSKKLEMVYGEFRISIKDENDFLEQRAILINVGIHQIPPTYDELPSDELEIFLTSNNEIIRNIKTKLDKLALASERQEDLIRDLVREYIVGQNELEMLNKRSPSIYKSILQLKSANQAQLGLRMLKFSDKNHGAILNEILQDYRSNLSAEFSSLNGALIERLSMEAISDWLGRCPLDFPDKGEQ